MNLFLGIDDAANGGRGNGEAMKLKDALNGYVGWANDFMANELKDSTKFNLICIEPKDDPSGVKSGKQGEDMGVPYFPRCSNLSPILLCSKSISQISIPFNKSAECVEATPIKYYF